MNLNATLLVQIAVFILFVWFTMKFVWPPLLAAMDERRKKIAEGLAAADRGHKELHLAQTKAVEELRSAKAQANEIIDSAHKRGSQIIDESKAAAKEEGERILQGVQADVQQQVHRARDGLRAQVSALAVLGAGRILERSIDEKAHAELLNKLVTEL